MWAVRALASVQWWCRSGQVAGGRARKLVAPGPTRCRFASRSAGTLGAGHRAREAWIFWIFWNIWIFWIHSQSLDDASRTLPAATSMRLTSWQWSRTVRWTRRSVLTGPSVLTTSLTVHFVDVHIQSHRSSTLAASHPVSLDLLKWQNSIDIKLSKDDGLQFFQEIQRFYHEHGSFFERHQYDGIPACLAKGFAKPDETFQQWMLRHRLPQLFARASVLLDLYGNFPVGSSPACQVLMILANKMPSILAPGLLLTSLQEDYPKWLAASEYGPLPEAMKSWATQLAGTVPPFMHRFRYGYGSLFASVVAKNRLDYRTKSRVHEIVPQVDVETGKRSLRLDIVGQASVEADVVVVAGRPDQIHRALPEDHPMAPLYAEVAAHAENLAREFGVYGVAVMSFEIAEDAGMLSGKRFVIDHQRHQLPMILDRLPAEVSVMRATKTADAKILTVTFQTTYALAGRSRERDLLRAELELYGFTNLSVLKLQHYPNTPTRVPLAAVAAGWYDKAEKAQGQQGIYFVGETFSGHGVPTTFLHTRDWCVRTFNLSFSTALSPPSAPRMAWIAALAVVPSVSPTTLLLGVVAAALAAKLLEKRASHAKKE